MAFMKLLGTDYIEKTENDGTQNFSHQLTRLELKSKIQGLLGTD